MKRLIQEDRNYMNWKNLICAVLTQKHIKPFLRIQCLSFWLVLDYTERPQDDLASLLAVRTVPGRLQ